MAQLFDLVLSVDSVSGGIRDVEWRNPELACLYGAHWNNYRGRPLEELLPGVLGQEEGDCQWENERFCFERLNWGEVAFYCFKRQDGLAELLPAALDYVQDGIQLYDRNANMLYLNKTSRVLSGFDDDTPIKGRHITDLYRYMDQEFSTTLTILRTRQPVHNRFGSFENYDGKKVLTLNTGYPVFSASGQLLGAVVLEQNMTILQEKMQRLEQLKAAMAQQLTGFSLLHSSRYSFADIIGSSQPLRHAVEIAQRISLRDGNVLLVGETGTGKEIFAQSIHYASARKNGKFVSINCAAIPESLVESILFGTTKGAFTGSTDKAGLFEEAADGTLFLDELNSMGLSMQSKLLRVLQEGAFRRIGGNRDLRTNARIISACNENPYTLVDENKMRRDLFYRVATIIINIPPLRDRPEDVEELAYYHLNRSAAKYAFSIREISPEALKLLQNYPWPGNVRELNHAIDYAMNLCSGEILCPEYLPGHLLANREGEPPLQTAHAETENAADAAELGRLQDLMDDYENAVIRHALQRCGGNISQAALLLDIKRQSLQYRLHKYNIIL